MSIGFVLFLSSLCASATKPELDLPYVNGAMYLCTQGSKGSYSHNHSTTGYDLDFAIPAGTSVLAAADGTAYRYNAQSESGPSGYGKFGWHVKIDHGSGYYTLYAHLSAVPSYISTNGTSVRRGETIGFSGGVEGAAGSGASTGAHLHFGLHQGNAWDEKIGKSVQTSIYAKKQGVDNKAYLKTSQDFNCDVSENSTATDGNPGSFYMSGNFSYPGSTNASLLKTACEISVNYCYLGNGLGGPPGKPDYVITQFWVVDAAGNEREEFHPGEQVYVKARDKNVGDTRGYQVIKVRFYRFNGTKAWNDPGTTVGNDEIQDTNLEPGETHTETESFSAPATLGTYNAVACVDPSDLIPEIHESNNCSREVVFRVVRRTAEERAKFLRLMDQIIND